MKKNFWITAAALVLIGIVLVAVFAVRKSVRPNVVSAVDLDRALIVGIVSWPGYVPGIVANGGFDINSDSIFTKKYGLPVKFVLIEDIDARGKAFAKGGPDGVDIVWSTVDFWANELPNFIAGGIDAKAIMQVDWSRGGDAIIADQSIDTIEDLKDKKIALVQFTPSHWLLETALRASDLSNADQQTIRDQLVFTQDAPSARAAFVAGQVDAAVVWEPDVTEGLRREHSHIVLSSKEYPNSIADVMVAKDDFIAQHPKAVDAFVRGWLDGVTEAQQNPEHSAQLLVDNEPLFGDLGLAQTKESLNWVYWPTLQDNVAFFGLDAATSPFDTIFRESSAVWKELGLIENALQPAIAKDDSFIRALRPQ